MEAKGKKSKLPFIIIGVVLVIILLVYLNNRAKRMSETGSDSSGLSSNLSDTRTAIDCSGMSEAERKSVSESANYKCR